MILNILNTGMVFLRYESLNAAWVAFFVKNIFHIHRSDVAWRLNGCK